MPEHPSYGGTVLVIGRNGQVAHALGATAPLHGLTAICAGRDVLDLAAPERIEAGLIDLCNTHRPLAVINAAAYTAVDRAEEERELAFIVNGEAPGRLASACHNIGLPFLHISTDYVFDGTKAGPYVESDPVAPINFYGESKLAGEQAVAAAGGTSATIRTSWVYGPTGQNFMRTMLRLGSVRPALRVVDDQFGSPTETAEFASALLHIAKRLEQQPALAGIYHYCGQGRTSWYGFARRIIARAAELRPDIAWATVEATDTAGYPTPAARPKNSEMSTQRLRDTFGIAIRPWEETLEDAMNRLDWSGLA